MSPPDDLASKANIVIDPSEIQAASMDDLDEDEESGAAQVGPWAGGLRGPANSAVALASARGRLLQRQWAALWPDPAG